MKAFAVLFLCAVGAFAQVPQTPPQPKPTPQTAGSPAGDHGQSGTPLNHFDLNFPGGTPQELVRALSSAMGKDVNVVFIDSVAKLRLPAVRVRNATVKDVFSAIEMATRREVAVPVSISGGRGNQMTNIQYRTVQLQFIPADKAITDDTVWSFVSNEPEIVQQSASLNEPERELRHFQLRDYLNDGLSVEDITTAIRTGWEMLGTTNPPNLKFHKETGILIASGDAKLLDQIPMVLQQLPKSVNNFAIPTPGTTIPRPALPPNIPSAAPKPPQLN